MPKRLRFALLLAGFLVTAWLVAEWWHVPAAVWAAERSLLSGESLMGYALHGQPVLDLLVAGSRVVFLYGTLSVLLCVGSSLFLGFYLAVSSEASVSHRAVVWVLDVLGSVPSFFLATVVLYAGGPSLGVLVLAFWFANWDAALRVAWNLGKLVTARPSYLADVALGYPRAKLFAYHYVPEVFGPLSAKFCSVFASFVVFGASAVVIGVLEPVQFPWGALINQGRQYFDVAPHVFWAGWTAVLTTTLVLTLLSSGIHLLFERKIPR